MSGKLTIEEKELFRELLESEMTVTELMTAVHLATKERAAQICEAAENCSSAMAKINGFDCHIQDAKAVREADYTEALRKAGTK
jgi:hypothetical protein